ncbi:MAG: agmatine deiminase family protein [Planctomycetota bacterium]
MLPLKSIPVLLLWLFATLLGEWVIAKRPYYQSYGNSPASGYPYGQSGYQAPNYTPNRSYANTTRKGTPTPASIVRYAATRSENYNGYPRLPGEFEDQQAILLSVSDLQPHHNHILTQIVEKCSEKIPLVILYNNQKQLKATLAFLSPLKCDLGHVSFCPLKLDTIWLRDFGPRMAETKNGSMSIDFFYNGQRPLDDAFPIVWGQKSGAEIRKIRWTIQCGNLLSNGRGLGVVSSRIFEDNFIAFPNSVSQFDGEYERRKIVVDAFKEECNLERLLVLEPLRPEATQHVDMFMTFLAPNHALVAKIDPRSDPVNAKVMDNNVSLLKQIKVDGRPMKVDRIPYPPRKGKFWSPYTNIILTKDLILFPTYQSDPPGLVQQAKAIYQRLVPGAKVDTIDMTTMQELEGALHCMSVNVPAFSELPKDVQTFASAQQMLGGKMAFSKDNVSKQKDTRPIKSNQNSTAAAKKRSSTPSLTFSDQTPGRQKTAEQKAVLSYRKRFSNAANTFGVDGFAIGFSGQSILLHRINDRRDVMIDIRRLSQANQDWISKNRDLIRRNGPRIKQYLLTNGIPDLTP